MKNAEAASEQAVVAARCYDVTVSLHGRQVGDFEELLIIGMAARLAFQLRGLPVVAYDLLRQVALHLLQIPPTSLQTVVGVLAEAEFVRLDRQGSTIRTVIPTVPYYEDLYETLGEIASNHGLSEPERLTIDLVNRLARSPRVKESLYNDTGAERPLVDQMLGVGEQGGYLFARRARGRDVIVSPLYFPENAAEFADLVAAHGSGSVGRVIKTIAKNQGWPLRVIQETGGIGDTPLTADEVKIVTKLAGEGFLPPPMIQTEHAGENHFLFGPKPGIPSLPPTKRPIYEAAMALVAAVRQGQLLPRAYRIRMPLSLLHALRDKRYLRANSEALEQYRELVVLRLGRLVPDGAGRHRFELIDTPENLEAVNLAIHLVEGTEPLPAVDDEVVLALHKGHDYLESLIGRQRLVAQQIVHLDPEKQREFDDLLLRVV
jgi:hypothetical protein